MISYTETNLVPFIGQIVHFYPDKQTRLAAFIVNTFPLKRSDDTGEIIRPNVSLQVCKTDGKLHFEKSVDPIDPENPDNITDRWSFANEIALEIEIENDEECEGVNANFHVGLGA